jgi:hypothetical protein
MTQSRRAESFAEGLIGLRLTVCLPRIQMNLSTDGLLLMPGGETREVYLPYVSGEKRQIF